MLQQLTDDFEFDESKGKLTEYDVSASATGTVSGLLYPLYISDTHCIILFCFHCKFQGCWLPLVSFLCARWGRVQRGREEGEVDICQVCSATIRILFIWISKISVKLSMYLSDVEHHKKKRMTRWARYNSPFTYMTRCNSTYSSNMTRDLGMILFKEMQARPMLVWIPSFSC